MIVLYTFKNMFPRHKFQNFLDINVVLKLLIAQDI